MFPLLIESVRSGDKTQIEQLLNNDKNTGHLSTEKYRELFKEAIMAKKYEIVQLFIDKKILDNERCPQEYLKAFKGRTLFGYAVFEMFDVRLIKILSSNGYDMLCNEECANFVSNLVENFNPDDFSGFTEYLDKLKVVLTLCSNVSWQRSFSELLFKESKIQEALTSVDWLNRHLKYGYGLCIFKTADKIHMELGEEMWCDAKNSILSLVGDDVNEYVSDSFPPGDNVPCWTLLAFAVFKRNAEIAKMLIDKGADVNMHSERLQDGRLIKFTPFELAVEMNFLEGCRLLIENGANIYLQSYNAMGNILANAIRNESVEMVKLILKNRYFSENVIQSYIDDLKNDDSDVPVKAQIKECLKVFKRFDTFETTKVMKALLLIEYGTEQETLNFIEDFTVNELNERCSPETFRRRNWTLLTFATVMNKITIVKALLEKGCDVNLCCTEVSYFKNTVISTSALLFAIKESNADMCEQLLSRGACLSVEIDCQWVISCAFKKKNCRLLSLIVQRLRDPNKIIRLFCSIDTLVHYSEKVSMGDILETFSLEVIYLFQKSGKIMLQTWVFLIQRCLEHREPLMDTRPERGRCLLYLIVDYLPFVPKELDTALTRHYDESPGNSLEQVRRNPFLFRT